MKKKILILCAMVILLAIIGGGTLAYFRAEDTAHNVITSGSIDIELLEWADDQRTKPFENPDGVMPGDGITKIVEVKNTCLNEAWVRIRMDRTIVPGEGVPEFTPDLSLIQLDIDEDNWIRRIEDGVEYYYYDAPLAPGAVTPPLFTRVKFLGDMGNDYQNSTFHIDLQAQAVQTLKNGTEALAARGWPKD